MESISHPPKLNKYDREALDSTETHPNLLDGSRRFTYFITASIDSFYHPATFHVEHIIPPHYPMNPPRVRFLTRIFHPHINKDGRIDPDKCVCRNARLQCTPTTNRLRFTLGWRWSPHIGIEGVMRGVTDFLNMPASRDWAFLHLKHNYDEVGQNKAPKKMKVEEICSCIENHPSGEDVMRLKKEFHHPFPVTVSRALLTFIGDFQVALTITTFLDANRSRP